MRKELCGIAERGLFRYSCRLKRDIPYKYPHSAFNVKTTVVIRQVTKVASYLMHEMIARLYTLSGTGKYSARTFNIME